MNRMHLPATPTAMTLTTIRTRAISLGPQRRLFTTTSRMCKPPAQALRVSEPEDEPLDLMESRGVGMERLVEGYQHREIGSTDGVGNYRDYIKVRLFSSSSSSSSCLVVLISM